MEQSVRVQMRLPRTLRNQIKIHAAATEKSMNAVLVEAVSEHLKNNVEALPFYTGEPEGLLCAKK